MIRNHESNHRSAHENLTTAIRDMSRIGETPSMEYRQARHDVAMVQAQILLGIGQAMLAAVDALDRLTAKADQR